MNFTEKVIAWLLNLAAWLLMRLAVATNGLLHLASWLTVWPVGMAATWLSVRRDVLTGDREHEAAGRRILKEWRP